MLTPLLLALVGCVEPVTPVDGGDAPAVDSGAFAPDLLDRDTVDRRGAWLFDEASLRTFSLEIAPADMEHLRQTPDGWVPAQLSIDDVAQGQVGVRIKGNGSFQPIDAKPSLKISTDRFVDGLDIDGIDAFSLDNNVLDPSLIRARLAYSIYREAGVPASRASHAQVVLNGALYGLYTLVEGVDGRFLDRWYSDDDGALYEMFDVDFTAEDIWFFEHDGGPDERGPLLGLAQVLADDSSRLTEDAAHLLNVEQFTRYFAVSAVVGQFDAYPYSFPGDDVYLYIDPADGRIGFIPHGCDETFNDSFRPVDYVFGLLGQRCLQDPVCEQMWSNAVWEIQHRHDLDTRLSAVEAVMDQVFDAAAADPRKPSGDFGAGQADVLQFIADRETRLASMPGLLPPE